MKSVKNISYVLIALIIITSGFFITKHFNPAITGDNEPNIKACFSPAGGISKKIINEIEKAEKSIDVAMYSFTKRDLAWALVKAKERGVEVRIILDGDRVTNKYSKYRFFKNKNILPKLIQQTMHNKFAIIDEKLLITGSYNWTASAEKRNFENILFIRNSPRLIKEYSKEFNGLWRIGTFGKEERTNGNQDY